MTRMASSGTMPSRPRSRSSNFWTSALLSSFSRPSSFLMERSCSCSQVCWGQDGPLLRGACRDQLQ